MLPGILFVGIALVYRLDDDDGNIGVYFRSPVGRRAAVAGALLSLVLTPLLVIADEWWIDLPGLLPSLPTLISNGLVPLPLTLLGLAAIYGGLRWLLRAKDADTLARTIREGVPGTLMASWSKVLDDDAIADVVAFLRNWDAVEAAGLQLTAPAPLEIDLDNPEEILALGQRIFDTTCSACHGENGSGGSGPVLNSQQILTRNTDEQLRAAIVSGGRRPNSTMPAFGDRMTSVEIDAVVQYLRSWEPTAPQVANPRGSGQGGGPPWQRATPDPNNPLDPGQGGGPPAGRGPNRIQSTPEAGQTPAAERPPALAFAGEVVAVQDNLLTFHSDDGALHEAMLGPPWFWAENGIALGPGHAIELEGFESTDHMELNWIRNLTTNQLKLLRTAEGTPVWTQ